MKKHYSICTIGGDGIGPEVVGETVKLLQHLPVSWDFVPAVAGFAAYEKYGTPLPDETVDLCKKADAVLFGAVTTPPNIKNYFSPIVRLRKFLDTYANVRPFFSLPLQNAREGIDLIIVRENTEDLYSGKEELTEDGAVAQRVITRKASEQIIDLAFHIATKEQRIKVTLLHKANVLRLTDGLFLETGREIAKYYPEIIFEEMLIDAAAMKLVMKPTEFDVIVTTNMFGDILSDEAAGLVGGLGVAASANVGKKYALFEPVHGSAPKYEGQNRANPLACFLSAAFMLDFLGEHSIGQKVKTAILQTVKQGEVTVDLGGKLSMTEFTDKVIRNLELK